MTEIIGEAAYKLTHEFTASHPELPWKEIIGMRHILVHGYFRITPEDLWDVIQMRDGVTLNPSDGFMLRAFIFTIY